MSKNAVEANNPDRWIMSTSCDSRAVASDVDEHGSEPVWWWEMRPRGRTSATRRDWTVRSISLDSVSRRTMTLKLRGVV